MRVKLFIALGMLGMSLFTYAGSRHAAETSYPSYKGLVMAGYQGGFVDRRMVQIKVMAIMEPESNLTRNIVPLMHGPM